MSYTNLTDLMSAIGSAIREKDGTTELIPTQDMPDRILAIEGGGSFDECIMTLFVPSAWYWSRYTEGRDKLGKVECYNTSGVLDKTFDDIDLSTIGVYGNYTTIGQYNNININMTYSTVDGFGLSTDGNPGFSIIKLYIKGSSTASNTLQFIAYSKETIDESIQLYDKTYLFNGAFSYADGYITCEKDIKCDVYMKFGESGGSNSNTAHNQIFVNDDIIDEFDSKKSDGVVAKEYTLDLKKNDRLYVYKSSVSGWVSIQSMVIVTH